LFATRIDRSKLQPAQSFYLQQFGHAATRQRPDRRGYITVPCCFHQSANKKSRSLSVNLREGNFYCFSCGAKGGDIIAFLRLRDRMTFQRACISLGVWLENPDPRELKAIRQREQEREKLRAEEQQRREAERRDRIEVRTLLHRADKLLASACQRADWSEMPKWFSCVRIMESRYRQLAGLGEL
jgi:hypothetical protein